MSGLDHDLLAHILRIQDLIDQPLIKEKKKLRLIRSLMLAVEWDPIKILNRQDAGSHLKVVLKFHFRSSIEDNKMKTNLSERLSIRIPLTNRHNKKKEKVGQAVSVSRGIHS